MIASNCVCNCSISVTLIPLGGNGCGIQIIPGNFPKSIGSQYFSFTYVDPCNVVSTISINGNSTNVPFDGLNPTFVSDGETISVAIGVPPAVSICSALVSCTGVSSTQITNEPLAFWAASFTGTGRTLVLNKKAIAKRLLKRKRN